MHQAKEILAKAGLGKLFMQKDGPSSKAPATVFPAHLAEPVSFLQTQSTAQVSESPVFVLMDSVIADIQREVMSAFTPRWL